MLPALVHRTRLQHMQSTTSPSDFRKNFALALLEEKPEWVSQVFGARLGPPMKRWNRLPGHYATHADYRRFVKGLVVCVNGKLTSL